MVEVRSAKNGDIIYLRKIDLQCHETEPNSPEWWKELSKNPAGGCIVVAQSRIPIGFCAWEKQVFSFVEDETEITTLHFHKLCISEGFRKRGHGLRLLAAAYEEAIHLDCQYLSTTVPEFTLLQAGKWLNSVGFEAKVVLPEKLNMYGREWDQIFFVRKVR